MILAWRTTVFEPLLLQLQELGASSRMHSRHREHRHSRCSHLGLAPSQAGWEIQLQGCEQFCNTQTQGVGAHLTSTGRTSQFGGQAFSSITLSLPEPLPRPTQRFIPYHNDCISVTFSYPSLSVHQRRRQLRRPHWRSHPHGGIDWV